MGVPTLGTVYIHIYIHTSFPFISYEWIDDHFPIWVNHPTFEHGIRVMRDDEVLKSRVHLGVGATNVLQT